ncbi:TPA: type II toxin-antitoxin system VapC family toxin [Candidatus Woesearchaeota archaeon]|nr:type II toxin-antitoxin system VapC family toxin [Candidatus Woesearchaeota archaeon]
MILDTSAWVEFIEGTEKGRRVKSILEREENFTSLATIAELAHWCLRSGREDVATTVTEVKRISQILPLTETISITAGKLNYERKKASIKWGMMDSLIVATAQTYGLKILTKDNAFWDLPEAEIL